MSTQASISPWSFYALSLNTPQPLPSPPQLIPQCSLDSSRSRFANPSTTSNTFYSRHPQNFFSKKMIFKQAGLTSLPITLLPSKRGHTPRSPETGPISGRGFIPLRRTQRTTPLASLRTGSGCVVLFLFSVPAVDTLTLTATQLSCLDPRLSLGNRPTRLPSECHPLMRQLQHDGTRVCGHCEAEASACGEL